MLLKDILIQNKLSKKIAIKEKNSSISYNELFEKSTNISVKINNKNICMNNIGIFLPNSIQYAIAYFGITFCNKVIVPIDINSKYTELTSIIQYCELRLIITNEKYLKVIHNELQKFNFKVCLFNVDDNRFYETGDQLGEYIDISETVISNDNDDDVAIMLHTSGTTSYPKRVMLTHKNLISNIKSNIKSLDISSTDKVLIALPMFFGYCNTAQFLSHLYVGAQIVILNGLFMPKEFFICVEREKITNFTAVPSMLIMLLNFKHSSEYEISSLKFICFGGGVMPLEKLKLLINEFPSIGFVQTYGQTEASPRVTALLSIDSLRKIGSVGKTIPDVNLKVVNQNDLEVNIGEIGEIIVNGENVMKGYYKRPDETKKVIRNGWLYTGDLGYYDSEKYIYLVGRKKNLIISGGTNIYPEEIEELLICHPEISDACVISEADPYLGEIPVAKVILKDNKTNISENDLKKYCIDNLANYKVPRKIYFVDDFKKTSTGKTKRY